ncbi:Ig-like domain-containing protein, partial [Nocardioides sp.]|uniref:Ig-like domain-containing protein n=1 Tax=Nocardioides sp. TaxID=35761 RepID=UPI002734EDCB
MSATTIVPAPRRLRPRLAALGLALALVAGLLGLSATQAEPGQAEARNVALNAVPSASFTASHNNLNAINNGVHTHSGPPETSYWGTWTASDRPASQYLQYDWVKPMQVDRTVVSFWTDAAPGTGNNVTVPESWTLDHWDDDAGEWAPVTGASGFGTHRTGMNETTFDPVTTTRLRATFQAYPNSTGTSYSALGVSEWEVWGDLAEARPETVIDIPVTHVRTTSGVAPGLPSSLDVVRLGGRVTPLDVEWDPLPEELAEGAVEVTGELDGVSERAEATVWVRESPSSTIVAVDDVAVITTVGVRPVLPSTVTATYDDTSRASDIAVTWPSVSPAGYAEEGVLELLGSAAGTDLTPTAWVFVQPADGSESPPSPTTTSATPTTQTVPFGRAAQLRVRVAAEEGIPGGTVSVDGDGRRLGTATLADGQATVVLSDPRRGQPPAGGHLPGRWGAHVVQHQRRRAGPQGALAADHQGQAAPGCHGQARPAPVRRHDGDGSAGRRHGGREGAARQAAPAHPPGVGRSRHGPAACTDQGRDLPRQGPLPRLSHRAARRHHDPLPGRSMKHPSRRPPHAAIQHHRPPSNRHHEGNQMKLHRHPRWLALVATTALLAAGQAVVGTSTDPAHADDHTVTWTDDFEGAGLDPRWEVVSPEGNHVSVSDGALRIVGQPGDTYQAINTAKNLVMLDIPNGDFTATTTVAAEVAKVYQGAGLIAWQDMDNYVRSGLTYVGTLSPSGIAIENDVETGAVFTAASFTDRPGSAAETLRLRRVGDTITTSYL